MLECNCFCEAQDNVKMTAAPVEDGVASLISSVDTVLSKSLQKAGQGSKEDVNILICEINIRKVPLAAA